MANWYGTSRSNYFRIKDEAQFRQWVDTRGISIIQSREDPTLFAVHPGDSTGDGSWPSYDMDADAEVDFLNELSQHLAKDEVAVLLTAGAEKLRYITGEALAVNYEGKVVDLSLLDIYQKAARAFRVPLSSITHAEY